MHGIVIHGGTALDVAVRVVVMMEDEPTAMTVPAS